MFIEACWLVKNGIPLTDALCMPEEERMALAVTFASFEGAVFNWHTLRYEERK